MSSASKPKNQKQHEQLDPQPKFRIVRQDRIECDPERHSLELGDGKTAKVVNYSLFGIAIETEEKPKDAYPEAVFLVDGYTISQIGITAVRSHQNDSGQWITGFSINADPLDVDAAQAVKQLNEILEMNTKDMTKDSGLREPFRLKGSRN